MSTARFVGQNSASVPRICISAIMKRKAIVDLRRVLSKLWRIISLATKIMSIIFEMLVKVISKQSIAMAGNSLIRLSTLK